MTSIYILYICFQKVSHHSLVTLLQRRQLNFRSSGVTSSGYTVLSPNPCRLFDYTGIMSHMCPANERRRYNVTSSLIGWAHTQNDPWLQLSYITVAALKPCGAKSSSYPLNFINSLSPWRCGNIFTSVFSNSFFTNWYIDHFLWN